MDCVQLEKWAREGQLDARLGEPDVVAHLRDCGGCEALYGRGSILGDSLVDQHFQKDFSELQGQLTQLIEREDASIVGRLRALPTSTRRAAVLSLFLLLLAAIYFLRVRVDFTLYPAQRMAVTLGAFMLLASLAAWEALRPLSEPMLLVRRNALLALALVIPLAMALLPQPPPLHPANHGPDSVLKGVLVCLGFGSALAAPVVALLMLLDRAGVWETRFVWLVAGFGGVVGNALLQLHCPITDSTHLFWGHAPLFILVAILAVARQRNLMLKWLRKQ